MQIKKINNNKLKVILSSNDLTEKNIDIDSFLSNSIESQNLFFEILDLAEEKYDFNIENNKAIVETISLDNNLFILTITKLKNDILDASCALAQIYCFDSIDDIFSCFLFNKNDKKLKDVDIYELNQRYYLILNEISPSLETSLSEFSSPIRNQPILKDVLIEYGKKIN